MKQGNRIAIPPGWAVAVELLDREIDSNGSGSEWWGCTVGDGRFVVDIAVSQWANVADQIRMWANDPRTVANMTSSVGQHEAFAEWLEGSE